MKRMMILICFLLLLLALASCMKTTDQRPQQMIQNETDVTFSEYSADTSEGLPEGNNTSDEDKLNMEQTGYTMPVLAAYTKASNEPGAVVRVDYDSKDYVRDEAPILKTAYVYTPYGYDENDTETRYDILYLMHSWSGHAGEYFEYANLKNLFDNLIEKGEISPLIIVSATFYNANSNTDFSSSIVISKRI